MSTRCRLRNAINLVRICQDERLLSSRMTVWIPFALSSSAVKRLARRHRDKIADSIEVKTADNKTVKIKPIIITRNKVSKPVQRDIRKKARDYIAYKVSKLPVERIAQDLISKKFQRSMVDILRKISPIAVCEIRDFHILATERSTPKAEVAE